MTVSVAEYLGQRTDVASPSIVPASAGVHLRCPFMNDTCSKLSKSRPNKPVCSVRKADGTLWIVCSHRLCATKKKIALSDYQIDKLHQVAKTVFNEDIALTDILVRREASMPVVDRSKYSADYIMLNTAHTSTSTGQSRIVLEMQGGGGETSKTGALTDYITEWEAVDSPSNDILSEEVRGPAPIVTNAWRRQQEQFIIKGNIAVQTGAGLVFCVGTLLYDYLWSRVSEGSLNDLRQDNWTLALVGFCEDTSAPPEPGPIPLVVDESRLLFTNYSTFINILTNQGQPCRELFQGTFDVLNGGTKTLE